MLGYNLRAEPFPEQREGDPLALKHLFHLGGYGHGRLLDVGESVHLIHHHQLLGVQFLQLLEEELGAKVSRAIANQQF